MFAVSCRAEGIDLLKTFHHIIANIDWRASPPLQPTAGAM
jgi:hypothetical protein